MANSELQAIITDIRKKSKQISINKVDEVRVMKAMLNDGEYSIGVYDKSQGYIGQHCPHDDAIKFVKNVIQDATGLDAKDAQTIADGYQFKNRDANFLLNNMRDFLYIYTGSGRKINIMQSADTDAAVYIKPIGSQEKLIPDKDNPGKTKKVTTSPYMKLVCSSKCPRYALNSDGE